MSTDCVWCTWDVRCPWCTPEEFEDNKVDQLVFMLEEMVKQDCEILRNGNPTGEYFSQFITVYADAMRLLAKCGRMTINDAGGRIVAGTFV